MVLFILRKQILQTRKRSHPGRLDVWLLVWPFVYFHTSCARTAKALAKLRRLAWAFTGRLCDKYHNPVSWLIYWFPWNIEYEIMYNDMGRVKWIWYLLPMRAAKVQASLHICAVLPEPLLLAHTSSESRGTFTQKARSLAPEWLGMRS